MKLNRIGVTRIIIEFETIVVKIPNFTCQWSHFLRGLVGNMEESRIWRWNSGDYEKGTSHLLCPVRWCSFGGWVLIMDKVDELVNDSNRHLFDCTMHLLFFKGDDTIANYGFLKGKLVKIDYADLDHFWGEDFKKHKL